MPASFGFFSDLRAYPPDFEFGGHSIAKLRGLPPGAEGEGPPEK